MNLDLIQTELAQGRRSGELDCKFSELESVKNRLRLMGIRVIGLEARRDNWRLHWVAMANAQKELL